MLYMHSLLWIHYAELNCVLIKSITLLMFKLYVFNHVISPRPASVFFLRTTATSVERLPLININPVPLCQSIAFEGHTLNSSVQQ